MVITVHTVSGTHVTDADFSASDEVKVAKDTIAMSLGVVASQLMLLHGETILEDTQVLEDVCGESSFEAGLTVVIVPQLTGIFCSKMSRVIKYDGLILAGYSDNSIVSIVAVFKDGTADIIVKEGLCSADDDPDGEYFAWLARYVGVVHYLDHDNVRIDVTLCQSTSMHKHLDDAAFNVIQGKWCPEEKEMFLEINLVTGKKWIMLQERDQLPAEYARNVQKAAGEATRECQGSHRRFADWVRQWHILLFDFLMYHGTVSN